jgi:hypothetical protein
MICRFTGVGIGHSSIRSHLKGLLKNVQAAFVKEKVHETELEEEKDADMPVPGDLVMEGIEMDELEEDVPVDDEDMDEDDEGWETEHGDVSESERGIDEDEY